MSISSIVPSFFSTAIVCGALGAAISGSGGGDREGEGASSTAAVGVGFASPPPPDARAVIRFARKGSPTAIRSAM